MLARFSNLFNNKSNESKPSVTETKSTSPSDPEKDKPGSSWADCFKRLNSRSAKREAIIYYDSNEQKKVNLAIIPASTTADTKSSPPLTSMKILSPTDIELTQMPGLSEVKETKKEEKSLQVMPVRQNGNTPFCNSYKVLIGSRIMFFGGVLLSVYEICDIMSSDKDTALITRWGLAAGMCLGSLLSTVEIIGSQFIKKIESQAALIITAQGIIVNFFGWRSPEGTEIQALTSPLLVTTVFSSAIANFVKTKTQKNHTRRASQSIVSRADNAIQSNNLKHFFVSNKIPLAVSAALIGSGSYGWTQAVSFWENALSQAAVHLGTLIPTKLISHHFLDNYFLLYRNYINTFSSSVSSIFLSEVISTEAGPAATIFFMMGLSTVLAADQTIRTYQVRKRIKQMELLKQQLKTHPDFRMVLEQIAQCKELNFDINKSGEIMLCGFNLSKIGFTKTNIKVFAALSPLILAGGVISGWSGLVQYGTAYTFLFTYFYGSNYFRLNNDRDEPFHRTVSERVLEKMLQPLKYIARISLFPHTILWGYYINYIWTKAYRTINDTNQIPDFISYSVTPIDFALFFGTAGGLYSRLYTHTQWEHISEETAKTILDFFKNGTNEYDITTTKEEISHMLQMAHVDEVKPDNGHDVNHTDVVLSLPSVTGNNSIDDEKMHIIMGKKDDKTYCHVSLIGLFSKTLRMNIVNNHAPDTSESKKLLYTAMWPDVWRLIQ